MRGTVPPLQAGEGASPPSGPFRSRTLIGLVGVAVASLGVAVALWLGWGDWNVIAAVNSSQFESLKAAAATLGTSIHHIGEFIPESPTVILKRGTQVQPAPRLESERFAQDSWFGEGIEGYIQRLLNLQLPGNHTA